MNEDGQLLLPVYENSIEERPASAEAGIQRTSAAAPTVRERMHSAWGQIVLALSNVPLPRAPWNISSSSSRLSYDIRSPSNVFLWRERGRSDILSQPISKYGLNKSQIQLSITKIVSVLRYNLFVFNFILFSLFTVMDIQEVLSKNISEEICDFSARSTLDFGSLIIRCAADNNGTVHFKSRFETICVAPEGIDARGAAVWLFPAYSVEVQDSQYYPSNGYWSVILLNHESRQIEIYPIKQSILNWIVDENTRLSEVLLCPRAVIVDVERPVVVSFEK